MSEPWSDEELLAHFRTIRVCGCDGGCTLLPSCPSPVLDGIGADWIANHFDELLAAFDGRLEAAEQRAQRADGRLEKAMTGITLSRALLNQADETMDRASCLTQTERALQTLDDVLAAMSAQDGEKV